MKVWERGAGTTLACGSGACAAVYAGWKKKLIEKNSEVQLEKGSLHINIVKNEAIMTDQLKLVISVIFIFNYGKEKFTNKYGL